ncbi:MAG: hypothetical protein WCS80_04330 [Bacilli bacterium]
MRLNFENKRHYEDEYDRRNIEQEKEKERENFYDSLVQGYVSDLFSGNCR